MSSKKPIVLKLDSSNFDDIDIYNTDYIDNDLTLRYIELLPKEKTYCIWKSSGRHRCEGIC